MKRISLAVLTALVCTLALLTLKPAYAQAADASAQLDRFSVFVGDWNCTGKELAQGKTPAHATAAQLHGEQAARPRALLPAAASPNHAMPGQFFACISHDHAITKQGPCG